MDILSEIFLIFRGLYERKDYKIMISIILIMFVSIAPSMSIIFLFKRELFLNLDIVRLIIICLILNIMLFIIFFILTSLETDLKDTLKSIETEGYEYDNTKKINIGSEIIIETISYIIIFTITTWMIYSFCILFNLNLNNEDYIKILLVCLGLIFSVKSISIYSIKIKIKKKISRPEVLSNS